ncbi:hypothetical protein [Legionella spiritensis]|uniref:Uncharacterized protein n=1 Tax=Legionella spiritensis TaxID=452 RepID=A0A0W0YX47_LEGSP|nr:hypothetical protein [Legionella spiritensis]KTD61428.1 hypothetical protein Lspi_2670 [Legionella spiritensis]SNV33987.1 Uncharacterised protein [Legionella spiritensis]
MPIYVYTIQLLPHQIEHLKEEIQFDINPRRETARQSKKLRNAMINVGVAAMWGGVIPMRSDVLSQQINAANRAMTELERNPYGTVKSGNLNGEVYIDSKSISQVQTFGEKQGEYVHPPWNSELITPYRDTFDPADINKSRTYFFISTVPPERVHQEGELTHGVMATDVEDVERFIECVRDGSLQLDLKVSPVTKPHEVASTIPFEVVHRIPPKYLLTDAKSRVNMEKMYSELLEDRQKILESVQTNKTKQESVKYKLFQMARSKVPLPQITPPIELIKESESYNTKAELYRDKLAVGVMNNKLDPTENKQAFEKLVNTLIWREDPINKINQLTGDDLLKATPEEFSSLNDDKNEAINLKFQAMKEAFQKVTPEDAAPSTEAMKAYKDSLIDFIDTSERHCKSYGELNVLHTKMNEVITQAMKPPGLDDAPGPPPGTP